MLSSATMEYGGTVVACTSSRSLMTWDIIHEMGEVLSRGWKPGDISSISLVLQWLESDWNFGVILTHATFNRIIFWLHPVVRFPSILGFYLICFILYLSKIFLYSLLSDKVQHFNHHAPSDQSRCGLIHEPGLHVWLSFTEVSWGSRLFPCGYTV